MNEIRFLVTGSRDWTDGKLLLDVLSRHAMATLIGYTGLPTLVHGACPTGADSMAHAYWHYVAGPDAIEKWPADWKTHGKKAGPIRNAEMVRSMSPGDMCFAFIKNKSRGATGCANLARAAGLQVVLFEA